MKKALAETIAANAVALARLVGMVVLAAAVVVAVREHLDKGGVPKAPALAGPVVMAQEDRVVRGSEVDSIGVMRVIKGNGASRRSRCRKSWLPSFRMRKASNPWRGR